MNEIEQVLDRAARSVEATPSSEVVDADVRRGQSALVRRRHRRAIWSSAGSTLAAAAIVATAIVVGGSDSSGDAPAARPNTSSLPDTHPEAEPGVRLVAYTGEQPDGFIVDQVPDGWHIQDPEHPQFSLTIAPNGDTPHPDAFDGKLIVFLLSSSVPQQIPDYSDPVTVNGQPGAVTHDDASDTLTYAYPDGRYVQVQAWREALHWSNEQLVQFAEGVEVTSDAEAGVG